MCRARQLIRDIWFRDHIALVWWDSDFVKIPSYALDTLVRDVAVVEGDLPHVNGGFKHQGVIADVAIPLYYTPDSVPYDQRTKIGTPMRPWSLRVIPPAAEVRGCTDPDGACTMNAKVADVWDFTHDYTVRDLKDDKPHPPDVAGISYCYFCVLEGRVRIDHALINGNSPV